MQQLQEKLNAAQRDTEKIKNKNEELHDQVKEAKHSKEEQRKAAEVEIERCVRERAKCRKMEADVKVSLPHRVHLPPYRSLCSNGAGFGRSEAKTAIGDTEEIRRASRARDGDVESGSGELT